MSTEAFASLQGDRSLLALLEGLSDAFLVIDRQWRITYANPVALAPMGAALEEVAGHDLWERFPVLAGSPIGAAYRRAMEERVPVHIEDQGAYSGKWYEVIVHPWTEGIAVYARDITERRQAEDALREARQELEEANRRKDRFLAMLAHELRNPLAPIRNAAQVLRMPGLDPDRIEKARGMIDRQVAHMARLIDDLLDVSRISQGKILIRREPVDLAALVRATAEDHRPLLEDAGLTLLLEVPDRPLWMDGDPTRLAQALGNLLQNAIKFTNPEGRVTVRLAERAGAADLTVADTGVGMEPEILARLFQPFSQADQTLDRSRGGLGLGLALVKGLVEMHGGSVEAGSDGGGRGSALTLRLPLQARGPDPVAGEAAAAPEAKALRVLIIEDNQDAADSLQILLELSGHRAEVAYTGKDGLDAARRLRPQVVLCDIGLPGGMNGYDVARGLRAEEPGVCLIALTGYAQEEDQRRAREAGFDRHLTKPVDPAALLRLLGELSVSPFTRRE